MKHISKLATKSMITNNFIIFEVTSFERRSGYTVIIHYLISCMCAFYLCIIPILGSILFQYSLRTHSQLFN